MEFKNTINNLKSSLNPWKICVKKFIFSKFVGSQAYSWHFTNRWTPSQLFFKTIFKPPPLCLCSPHVLTHVPAPPTPHQILKSPHPCSQYLWETPWMMHMICNNGVTLPIISWKNCRFIWFSSTSCSSGWWLQWILL